MTMLDFRKPKCVILSETLSTSGKYKLFFGQHWVAGHLCFDVGTINMQTGEITTRHYHETKSLHAKEDAMAFWQQFKQRMTERPEYEDQTEEFWKDIEPHVHRDRKPS